MYKLLLCWRYLRTRYIALASVISVMLGVATLIVVNSVMAGFTHEMRDRIRGILSTVVVESRSLEGFPDPEYHKQLIQKVAGSYIEGMTTTVHVPAMLNFRYGGEWQTRQINLIGIEESTHASVSDFSRYLQHPENRRQLSFLLRDGGYDEYDSQGAPGSPARAGMDLAGWQWRRFRSRVNQPLEKPQSEPQSPFIPNQDEAPQEKAEGPANPTDPFQAAGHRPQQEIIDPESQQNIGAVLGMALVSYRDHAGADNFLALPGDDVTLTFPTAGTPPQIVSRPFTIVDFYESKMSEYDASFVFVPLETLQTARGMYVPGTKIRHASAIQIKLKNDADGELVRDMLRQSLPPQRYVISTWRDKQGALLAAVQMETAVLNILLFMIIAVAGFGILAIFFMIVVEKTRDIGILKSLGASRNGIMGIFLGYGLSLGIVGSGVGMVMGLLFVHYINEIRAALEWATGKPAFDPSIYYFYKIPTFVNPATVAWIVLGALLIAVLASILPARRAARLHPVEALRYE